MIFNGETFRNYFISSSAYSLVMWLTRSPKNFEKNSNFENMTPQKEISCHIFKLAIFSKFFDDLMSHIIREYAGKEMKYFPNVSPLKIMDILLSPFMVFSLYFYFLPK